MKPIWILEGKLTPLTVTQTHVIQTNKHLIYKQTHITRYVHCRL